MNEMLAKNLREMQLYRQDLSHEIIRRNELNSICKIIVEEADELINENNFNPSLEQNKQIDWARDYLKV